MRSSTRVAANTGFLYVKMIISAFIALYSTRLVLEALGISDYGIFSLVAGVIALLSFLNTAMTISTQRYLSFYKGAGDESKLKTIFSTSVILHLIIGIAVVLVIEIVGLFLFNGALKIPADRLGTAKIVFHFMAVSTFFTINAVPYDASINAHENMFFDAFVGIFESFIKLGVAIWLQYTKFDRLILYGLMFASVTIFIRIIKSSYCSWKYSECRIKRPLQVNQELIKEMISFAGWNLFGSFCSILRSQGLAVVLNLFFGILVNAAYSIAQQVNSQLISFSTNMLKALNPQIMKSEGGGDRSRMLRLSMLACKMSFYILSFFAVPFVLEMPYILDLWLKEVPDFAVVFCRLYIVLSMLQLMTYPLGTAIQSVGRIKYFQIIVGSLLILNVPLAFVLLKLGLPPYSVLIGGILLECVAGVIRMWLAHRIAGLTLIVYFKTTLFPSAISVLSSAVIALIPCLLMEESLLRFVITLLTSTMSLLFFARFVVLSDDENQKIKDIFLTFYSKARSAIGFAGINKA